MTNPSQASTVAAGDTKTADVSHPHDYFKRVAFSLPKGELARLSQISTTRALIAIAVEWISIGLMIGVAEHFQNPVLFVAAVIFVGAKQQALFILGHDAVHFRIHKNRAINDFISDFFLSWPRFCTTADGRVIHGAHHQFLGTEKDGNRMLWKSHNADGSYTPEWNYPKTPSQLAFKLLKRSIGPKGLTWVFGYRPESPIKSVLTHFKNDQLVFSILAAAGLTYFGVWKEFAFYWVLPFCTVNVCIMYLRVAFEHSGIPGSSPKNLSRSTILSLYDRVFMLPAFIFPRNIGYHVEHHFYPSIPFYNLPAAHALLMEIPDYREASHRCYGVPQAFRELTARKPKAAQEQNPTAKAA